MISIERCVVIVGLTILFGGCGIGGFWMEGNPSAGKGITPLSDRWEKRSMTPETRRADWVECGGRQDGGYGVAGDMKTTEEIQRASREKYRSLDVCMQSRGYQRVPPEFIKI